MDPMGEGFIEKADVALCQSAAPRASGVSLFR